MMNVERIDKSVKNVVGNKYRVESHFSKTTNSYYVTIFNGENNVQLRFSDHMQKKNRNSKTFLVTNKVNYKCLEAFVANRIKMLQRISVYQAFDLLERKRAEQTLTPAFA